MSYDTIRRMRLLEVHSVPSQDFDYTCQAVGIGFRYKTPVGTYPFRCGLQFESSTVQRNYNDEWRGEHRGATIIARTVFLEHRPKLLILVAWVAGTAAGGTFPCSAETLDRVVASISREAITPATWSRNTGSSVSSMHNGRRPLPVQPSSPMHASA